MIKKIVLLLLCLAFALSGVACAEKGQEGTDTTQPSAIVLQENEKESVKETDIVFVSNGVSDYEIVVPQSMLSVVDSSENYAAREIQHFVREATGVVLPIVGDNGKTLDANANMISVGNTSVYRASDLNGTFTSAVFGNDGFSIKTYGKTVVLNAYGQNGVMYSAYGFLERVLGYEYFAEDCYTFASAENGTYYMKEMDVTDIPYFDQRNLLTGALDDGSSDGISDYDYVIRTRTHGSTQSKFGLGEGSGWYGSDTSIASVLIPATRYGNDKLDGAVNPYAKWSWYYPTYGSEIDTNVTQWRNYCQPCISALLYNYDGSENVGRNYKDTTNPEKIYTECVEEPSLEKWTDSEVTQEELDEYNAYDLLMYNVIHQLILPHKGLKVVFIGQNDTSETCGCATCKKTISEIKASGQMILLANKISESIKLWQNSLPEDSDFKNSVIKVGFFAYLATIESPTVYENGVYRPIREDITCAENVIVRIAPIHSLNMYPHYDEEINAVSANSFASWHAVVDELAVWDYGCFFKELIMTYPDWGTIKENLIFYHERGVKSILTQLNSRTNGCSLQEFKIYLRSRLMWDINFDVYELTEKFFRAYYGNAADTMLEYYEFLQLHFQMLDATGLEHGDIDSRSISSSSRFSYETTLKIGEFFERALEDLGDTEDEKYLKHVEKESLFQKFLMMLNYCEYLTKSEVHTLCSEFERIRLESNLRVRRGLTSGDEYFDGFAAETLRNWG